MGHDVVNFITYPQTNKLPHERSFFNFGRSLLIYFPKGEISRYIMHTLYEHIITLKHIFFSLSINNMHIFVCVFRFDSEPLYLYMCVHIKHCLIKKTK